MNLRLVAFAFLMVSFTGLAFGQKATYQNVDSNLIKPGQEVDLKAGQTIDQSVERAGQKFFKQIAESRQVVDQEWLGKQSDAILDIVRILYKGREPELTELESAQAKMDLSQQIERRIALIKATLSEKETK